MPCPSCTHSYSLGQSWRMQGSRGSERSAAARPREALCPGGAALEKEGGGAVPLTPHFLGRSRWDSEVSERKARWHRFTHGDSAFGTCTPTVSSAAPSSLHGAHMGVSRWNGLGMGLPPSQAWPWTSAGQCSKSWIIGWNRDSSVWHAACEFWKRKETGSKLDELHSGGKVRGRMELALPPPPSQPSRKRVGHELK